MSDREPGVFYILNLLQEEDVNPGGFHVKLCVYYYRDYGETLVDIYCHDINKNYAIETCEAVTDLTSEKPENNTVFLTWTAPDSDLTVEGYRIYRNHKLLTQQLIMDTYYLDENLDFGVYEYNILVYYTTGCISETSNFVSESVEEETCEPVTDLTSEKINDNNILLHWTEPESDLVVEGYNVFRNEQLITEELTINVSYLDENLQNGDYDYYVVTHYTNGCVSDTSNHIEEKIELGVKGVKGLEGVILFPNPTTGELRIENEELRIENVEIFDVYGRKESFGYAQLPKAEGRKEKGEGSMVLDISELRSGIYFLKITTETGIITKKVIKY